MTHALQKLFGLVWLSCLVLAVLTRCGAASPPVTASVTLPARSGAPTQKATRKPKAKRTTAALANPAAASGVPQLTHGPLVGAVTASTARVFLRTNQPASVAVQYGQKPDLSDAVTTAVTQTLAAHDFATQVTLDALQPGTSYYVNILVNQTPQLTAPYPTFKTFPPQGQASAFKFVILNDFFWTPTQTFRNAAREQPDFVVIGGDFSHSNPTTLAQKRGLFKNRYTQSAQSADLVNYILRKFAVAHFWDDHDYGVNNGDRTYPEKALSLQALQEFFPTYPLSTHGDWQKFSYGNADFFMLDSRSERDPETLPDGPRKSMLDGEQLGADGQWVWLTQGLLNSQAQWKFIFTPVPFNPTVPKEDAWNGYQNERGRLVDFIHTHNITGVIFLSGDLHAGAIDDGTNSGFPEMLVPPPNGRSCLTAPKPGTWSVGTYVLPPDGPCPGYGVVSVQTSPPGVMLTVKNQNSDTMLQLMVKQP